MTAPFPYKTPPLAEYQRRVLRATATKPFHFLALEQGTGKSWVTINTAAYLYLSGAIDTMLVLAPNGVHHAWARDQLPQHMPEPVSYDAHVWSSDYERPFVRTGGYSPALQALLSRDAARRALRVLCVNSEAVGVLPALDTAVTRFLRSGRCLLVVDEASDYANPTAKRTRALLRWGRWAAYRRCLDGTPVGKLPWDVWAMYRFLSPSILSYAPTYRAMKDAHGHWIEIRRGDASRPVKLLRKSPDGTPVLKHLDRLTEAIAPYTTRVTKAEALPFLPPKHYHKVYFPLTARQSTLITALRRDLTIALTDGATVTAVHALTQYIRIQQLASGYVATDPVWGDSPTVPEPIEHVFRDPLKENPRLLALDRLLTTHDPRVTPTLVWARFTLDLELLAQLAEAKGWRYGVYAGTTSAAERVRMVEQFQSGALDILFGNTAAGGRGLNLYRAEHVVYYSNSFGLRQRLQSEDRAHRIGSVRAVRYSDILGVHADPAGFSIDAVIVRALRQNKHVADLITQDPLLQAWV